MSFVFLSILQLVVNLFHQMLLHWQICSKMDRLYHKDRQGSFGATIRSSHQNHSLILTNVFFKFLRILSNIVGSSPGLSGQIFILLILIDDNWWTLSSMTTKVTSIGQLITERLETITLSNSELSGSSIWLFYDYWTGW